jgi:hypothetical protein
MAESAKRNKKRHKNLVAYEITVNTSTPRRTKTYLISSYLRPDSNEEIFNIAFVSKIPP